MTATAHKPGGSFTNVVNYLFEGQLKQFKDKKAVVLGGSPDLLLPRDTNDQAGRSRLIAQLSAQAQLQTGSPQGGEKNVGHHTLNFSIDDMKMLNAAGQQRVINDYVQMAGLENTQYLAVAHNDTEHYHVHLVFNRVQNNGKLYKPWKERIKTSERGVALSLRHDLMLVGKQQTLADTKGVHLLRANEPKIRNLMAEPFIGKARNMNHLEKISRKLYAPFSVKDGEVSIGSKNYKEADLKTMFFLNRQEVGQKAQQPDFGEKQKKAPSWEQKIEKLKNTGEDSGLNLKGLDSLLVTSTAVDTDAETSQKKSVGSVKDTRTWEDKQEENKEKNRKRKLKL